MKKLNLKSLYNKLAEKNAFWILLSVTLSVLMWTYITSVEETVQQNTYSGIPVVFTGEESIRDGRGLIISDVDTTSVRVKITGNRRSLSKFNASDLQATIDVSRVTQPNENSWAYELTFPSGVDTSGFTYEYYPDVINFTVEKEAMKNVPVRGVFNGSAAENYIANSDALIFEPAEIPVYGTESELEQIAYAWVTLNGENISSTLTESRPYVFMNSSGEELKLTHTITDVESVATTLTVNTIKEVALALDIIPGGGATAANCEIKMDIEKVTLSGDADELESMEKLIIGSIDLSDYSEDFEIVIPLQLAEGVQCITGETEVTVTGKFKDLSIEEFEATDLRISNLKTGYSAYVVTKKLKVNIRAPQETLDKINADNIRVVADMTDYTTASGTVKVPAKVYIDGVTGAGAVGDYTLTINISF